MPGEQTWPTQPFPTNPPPFVKQSFTKDDISPYNNMTAQQRATFMERFESAVNLGLYTPISEKWTVHIPGSNGGALFGTTSAEPSTGMVYVVGQNNPALIRLYKPGEGGRGGGGVGAGRQSRVPRRSDLSEAVPAVPWRESRRCRCGAVVADADWPARRRSNRCGCDQRPRSNAGEPSAWSGRNGSTDHVPADAAGRRPRR